MKDLLKGIWSRMKIEKKYGTTYLGIYTFFTFGCISLFYGVYSFFSNPIENNTQLLSALGTYSALPMIFFTITGTFVVYLAFKAQQEQIEIQKNEIKQNEEHDNIQNFQNNFFKMIDIYENILQSIEYRGSKHRKENGPEKWVSDFIFTSKSAIRKYYQWDFTSEVLKRLVSARTYEDSRENFNSIYENFMVEKQEILGHYFRHIYHILKLIYTNRFLFKDEGKFYSNILRAQLSSFELLFIFYNGLSKFALFGEEGEINFEKLLNKYSFFEHLAIFKHSPEENNIRVEISKLLNYYNDNAYGNRIEEIKMDTSINS